MSAIIQTHVGRARNRLIRTVVPNVYTTTPLTHSHRTSTCSPVPARHWCGVYKRPSRERRQVRRVARSTLFGFKPYGARCTIYNK